MIVTGRIALAFSAEKKKGQERMALSSRKLFQVQRLRNSRRSCSRGFIISLYPCLLRFNSRRSKQPGRFATSQRAWKRKGVRSLFWGDYRSRASCRSEGAASLTLLNL
jgi:hypothetical protein